MYFFEYVFKKVCSRSDFWIRIFQQFFQKIYQKQHFNNFNDVFQKFRILWICLENVNFHVQFFFFFSEARQILEEGHRSGAEIRRENHLGGKISGKFPGISTTNLKR